MRHVGASPLEHVTIPSHKLCAQKHALLPLLPGRKRVICNVPGSVCVCVCVCVCVKYLNQRLHHKHTPKMGSYLNLDGVIDNFNAVVPESVEPVLLHTCIHIHIHVHIDTHVHIHIHINVHMCIRICMQTCEFTHMFPRREFKLFICDRLSSIDIRCFFGSLARSPSRTSSVILAPCTSSSCSAASVVLGVFKAASSIAGDCTATRARADLDKAFNDGLKVVAAGSEQVVVCVSDRKPHLRELLPHGRSAALVLGAGSISRLPPSVDLELLSIKPAHEPIRVSARPACAKEKERSL